ncbi:MAG: PAS domain-containing protein, partial [Calditrichaeota bacterium]|nr:PAS domain-containing protein [Calditrichota bacterium]MCB0295153.1 PAS domain-containing protein [Calditrichota bacterium]
PIRKAIAGLQQAGEGGESQDFPLHTRGNGEIARLIDAFRRFSALTHRQLSEATGAQDYLETLFSLSPIPVLITDSAGKIERANQSAVTLFRIPLQQLQQRHLEELFGSSDYYTMKNHIDKSEEDL